MHPISATKHFCRMSLFQLAKAERFPLLSLTAFALYRCSILFNSMPLGTGRPTSSGGHNGATLSLSVVRVNKLCGKDSSETPGAPDQVCDDGVVTVGARLGSLVSGARSWNDESRFPRSPSAIWNGQTMSTEKERIERPTKAEQKRQQQAAEQRARNIELDLFLARRRMGRGR